MYFVCTGVPQCKNCTLFVQVSIMADLLLHVFACNISSMPVICMHACVRTICHACLQQIPPLAPFSASSAALHVKADAWCHAPISAAASSVHACLHACLRSSHPVCMLTYTFMHVIRMTQACAGTTLSKPGQCMTRAPTSDFAPTCGRWQV